MKVLITGGAGFIGSNIAKHLVSDEEIEKVTVVDNLITGFESNLETLLSNSKFQFVKGDIRDFELCQKLTSAHSHICHQAALGSVPRSIENPVASNDHNINGTLNIFTAAKNNNIKKIVFASSSSVYGDDQTLPKVESKTGKVLSPYALTKKSKEEYARLFGELYKLPIIGLRYFNVFGPFQNPQGAYAAVIPLFIRLILDGRPPIIHGKGDQSRDFTYIDNVVNANVLALKTDVQFEENQIFNIAYGGKTTVKDLYYKIAKLLGSNLEPIYGEPRIGDIKHSLADISKISSTLDYKPLVDIDEGLKRTVNWFKHYYEKQPT